MSDSDIRGFSSKQLLIEGLRLLGFRDSSEESGEDFALREIQQTAALLERYLDELELFNSAYDLVGRGDRKAFVLRHALDSLAAAAVLRELIKTACETKTQAFGAITAADIGSGAGLPGIPLAAAFPNIRFTLIERMEKRCVFLENCVSVLGLSNVEVLQTDVKKTLDRQFDVIVCRAFQPLDSGTAKLLISLRRKGGVIALYKAKKEKILKELTSVNGDIPPWKIYPLTLPFAPSVERNLVVF